MTTDLERAVERAGFDRDRRLVDDPALKRRRGIVHTPPEVARFAAQATDTILRDALGHRFGLADPEVAIVDPTCGPGAFLAAVLSAADGPGPRALVGIDLDADALARASSLLAEPARGRGYPLELVCRDALSTLEPFPRAIGDATVVILGNPPWAGRSEHRGAALSEQLLEDFRRDERGERLHERRLGVLSDAYVRFFRWAAEIARLAPNGAVVGLLTNASFLDGPVHRGMRACLARWFDGIAIVDLGGSALVARGRERDENVFGVRPGAAWTLAFRKGPPHATRRARIGFVSLRGSRSEKLSWLGSNTRPDLAWSDIGGESPDFLFRPIVRSSSFREAMSLAEMIPFHREGIQTNRDAFVVAPTRAELRGRLERFAEGATFEAISPRRHFDPERARARVRAALAADPTGETFVRPLSYRPFDERVFAALVPLCHRPRPELLEAMRHSSFCLVTVRKDRGSLPWAHFGATRHAPDNCWLSARSSCRTRAFPLRTPEDEPNLAASARDRFSERIEQSVDVESLFAYVLAILAAPSYRDRRGAAAMIDYPEIPLPRDARAFAALASAGRCLLEEFLTAPGDRSRGVRLGHHSTMASASFESTLASVEAIYREHFAE